MAFDVFLCHNSSDKEAVERVGQQLRDAGLAPWLDVWEIEAGQRWRVELERQLGTIPCAAVFVAADGIGPWQDREVDVILDEMVRRDGRVIPVLLPGCPAKPELPLLLRSFHWVDFRDDEPEAILSLVRGILGSKRVAPAATGKRGGFPLNNLRIPSLGGLFTGREAQLSVVESQLAAGGAGAQVLSGLGGVGKTRLAVEYAWRHAERYTAIFFVGADGEAELRRSFAALAGRTLLDLKLPPDAAEDVAIAEVVVMLRNRSGWLLILDNVDTLEAQQALRKILPLEGGRVLITSRLQRWPAGTRRLEVERLDPEPARDYLLKATEEGRSFRPGEETAAAALAEKLGFLPLALELTAAYIRANGFAFAEILAGWATEEQKVVAWHDPGATEYPRSLALTWERSFDKLDASSRTLLHFLAHLAPEPIPEGLLEAGRGLLAEAAGENFDGRVALAELQRYSLIGREIRGEVRFLSLHRLVQTVALDRIPADERAAWAELAVRALLAFLPDQLPSDVRSWPVWDPLRPHAARAVQLADKAGVAEPTAVLMADLGLLLKSKALFGEAEKLQRRALAIGEAGLGPDHPEVTTRLSNLAQLLEATNRLTEAEPLMRRVLEIDEAGLGPDHPAVARDLSNLAALLKETHRLTEAEPLMRRALSISEAGLGPDHQNIAIYLNNLAQLLQATDRLVEAEPLMRRALAIEEARLGPEHPNVAICLNNLAQLLQATNRLAEAEPLMRRALAIDEAGLGSDHPNIAIRLNNLAWLLQVTNRLLEAEPLIRRALAIDEAGLGPDHPNVAIRLNNLAVLLQDTNRLAKAEPLMKRALAILERGLGPDHPWTVRARNNLERLFQENSPASSRSGGEGGVQHPRDGGEGPSLGPRRGRKADRQKYV
jgi:tetratricopeptide (TPR) repeat protein